ncbi:MAG: HlyD family efflux transporter periplasmic adaptor subunit [Mucilaginibacter sp.]|uniref:HlyD family efflux transporter periplasmic adaptor subunit n=1 Tax=Mucilaginibacter sp. TaxID=1882438 RepID=UPI0032674EC5
MSNQIALQQRHTEEIQSIIGKPPSWLLNWGITIFFGILILILSSTEVIQYPDVIKTQLKIRSLNLDTPVNIKTSGLLYTLLVYNDQIVQRGQSLAIIETKNGKTVLKSPRDGKVNYHEVIHEGQELRSDQTIFQISNIQKDFFGELSIPQSSIAKIKPGQDVLLKVRNFPFQEYGLLHGKIRYIIEDPFKNSGYLGEVEFNTNNVTDMKKVIALKQGLDADAEVIIQRRSLLKRITENAFKNFIK